MQTTTLGIDLAKSVFHLHGAGADGAAVLQKKVRRGALRNVLGKLDPCLIGMETCATSRNRARQIAALGHDVRGAVGVSQLAGLIGIWLANFIRLRGHVRRVNRPDT